VLCPTSRGYRPSPRSLPLALGSSHAASLTGLSGPQSHPNPNKLPPDPFRQGWGTIHTMWCSGGNHVSRPVASLASTVTKVDKTNIQLHFLNPRPPSDLGQRMARSPGNAPVALLSLPPCAPLPFWKRHFPRHAGSEDALPSPVSVMHTFGAGFGIRAPLILHKRKRQYQRELNIASPPSSRRRHPPGRVPMEGPVGSDQVLTEGHVQG
jgi:hypothetical protein